jgi:hypothetical protein
LSEPYDAYSRNTFKSVYYKLYQEDRYELLKVNKRQRIVNGKSGIYNPEKLGIKGTQDEDKQNKITTQYMLDTTIRKQTQIT